MKKSAKKAFTLIELMVVVVIVGIIAAVAGAKMQGMVNRAIKAEIVSALGIIKTAQFMYHEKYHAWPKVSNFSDPNNQLSEYIKPGILNGLYVSEDCYKAAPVDLSTLTGVGQRWTQNNPANFDLLRALTKYWQTANLAGCQTSGSDSSKSPKADKAKKIGNIYMVTQSMNTSAEGLVFELDQPLMT
jgi:prepilin-type N-terminal cleavage/methylation domain-containing protein